MKKYLSFKFSNIVRRLYFTVKSDFNKLKEFANTEEKMKKIEECLQILFGVYLDYRSFNWAGKGAMIVGFFVAHLDFYIEERSINE